MDHRRFEVYDGGIIFFRISEGLPAGFENLYARMIRHGGMQRRWRVLYLLTVCPVVRLLCLMPYSFVGMESAFFLSRFRVYSLRAERKKRM